MSNDGLKIFLQRQNCSDASHCTFTLLWPFLVCNMKIHVKTFGRLRRHWMQNLQRPREIRGGHKSTQSVNASMWQRWPIPAQHTHTFCFVLQSYRVEAEAGFFRQTDIEASPVQCKPVEYKIYILCKVSIVTKGSTLDIHSWQRFLIDWYYTHHTVCWETMWCATSPEFCKTIFEVDFATETVLPTWVVCRLITKSAQISAVGLLIIVFLSRPMLKTLLYSNAILQDIVQYCAEVQYCRIFCTVAQWCKAQPCSRIRCIQEFAL